MCNFSIVYNMQVQNFMECDHFVCVEIADDDGDYSVPGSKY